jgi:hypothetical protein
MTTTNMTQKQLDRDQELAVRMMFHRLCCVHTEETGDVRKDKGRREVRDSDLNLALGADGCECLTRAVVVFG